jgi:hypothetical protein
VTIKGLNLVENLIIMIQVMKRQKIVFQPKRRHGEVVEEHDFRVKVICNPLMANYILKIFLIGLWSWNGTYIEILEDKKVKLVTYKLKGRIFNWLKLMQCNRTIRKTAYQDLAREETIDEGKVYQPQITDWYYITNIKYV